MDAENYDFWNLVAKRDVAFEELSKNGIQATKYDLKQQLAQFKKSCEKIDYISRIKDSNAKDIKTELLENCHSPTQPSNITVPLMTESFETNLNKIDECDVLSYNQFDLNKLYYQNPGKVIPILKTVINAPTTDKNL